MVDEVKISKEVSSEALEVYQTVQTMLRNGVSTEFLNVASHHNMRSDSGLRSPVTFATLRRCIAELSDAGLLEVVGDLG